MASSLYEICKICESNVRNPRVLTCFHSFCLKCLESSSVTKCPTCQIEFEVPEGGLKDLKKGGIFELSTKPKMDFNCDCCNDNQAIQFCVDCSFSYCSTCLEYHRRIPASRNHWLQSAVSSNDPNIKKYSTCKDHSEAMTLFCENCRVVLCERCLMLKHNSHKVKRLTEYFDSVKETLEQDIKINEEILRNVVSNYKSSDFMISAHGIKTSNLNKEIQQRNSDLKKKVDSTVVALIKDVDEKFQQCQKDGKDVLKILKSMETNLKSQIEIMKEQEKSLSYENVAETSLQITEWKEDIPKYCDSFNYFLRFDLQSQIPNLKKLFGNIGKERLKPAKKNKFPKFSKTSYSWKFAMHRDNVFISESFSDKPLIHAFKCSESTVKIATYSHLEGFLHKETKGFQPQGQYIRFQIQDLLVIGNTLFIAVLCTYDCCKVIKVPVTLGCSRPTTIYDCHADDESMTMGLSKTVNGNILVTYFYNLFHLSENGEILKKIEYNYHKIPDPFYDAVQLEDRRHVVIYDGKVRIINDNGDDVAVHSHSNKSFRMEAPHYMVKDKHEDIYVYDSISHYIFVLDRHLRFKECYEFGRRIHEMLYDEERHKLMVLSGQSLLTFDL